MLAGAGHAGTQAAARMAQQAERLGAAGLLVAPMREAAGNVRAIMEFYRRLAGQVSIPICVQDHPESSGVALPAEVILKLLEQVPALASVKVEEPPTPAKIAALCRRRPRRDVTVLAGLGGLYSYFDLEGGADGLMTGFAFPEVLVALQGALRKGRQKRALEIYRRFLPLIVFEQQPGVAMRKEILRRRGWIASARVRHPGASAAPAAVRQLEALLRDTFGQCDLSKPVPTDAAKR